MQSQFHKDGLSGTPRVLVAGVPVRRALPERFIGSQSRLFFVQVENLCAEYKVNYWRYVDINYSFCFFVSALWLRYK